MKRTKLVFIEWIDSVAPAECSWMSPDEINEFTTREKLIRDVGWVIQADKDYISLVAGLSEEPKESDWASMYHRLIRIPKRCILKYKDLTRFIPK